MKRKFIIFLLAVIFLIAIAGYWVYSQMTFSKGILKLEILGPNTVQMGDEFEYTIRYKNNSDFTLEEPRLSFEFPGASVTEDGKDRMSKVLEDIYPGDEQFIKLKARLVGKEGDLKVAKAALSYKPKNIKARYESDTTFTTTIETVPLTLDFDLPTKLEKGKEVEFQVNYFSNIDYKLSGLRLNVEYPQNFVFVSGNPAPLDQNEWDITDLDTANGGRVSITGDLNEDVGKKVQFIAKLGIWKDGEFTLLKEATRETEIIEPLLYISQQINGSPTYVPSPGETIHYQIFFRNIGNTPFENLFLINYLDSSLFDLSTINVPRGQVREDDNMIVWDWKQVSSLKYLDVQEEGEVDFDITLKSDWGTTDPNSMVLKNRVNISQISQDFQTKVSSKLMVIQQGFYTGGIFNNTGSIPPTVGQVTTYTITWQAKNYYNDAKNVKVRMTLPQGVTLTGEIFPSDQAYKFSFDSSSREILWNAGDMISGTGVSSAGPSVSFQISVTPRSSQKGVALLLANKAVITGEDQVTGQIIQSESSTVNTMLPDDQGIVNHSGIVQ